MGPVGLSPLVNEKNIDCDKKIIIMTNFYTFEVYIKNE